MTLAEDGDHPTRNAWSVMTGVASQTTCDSVPLHYSQKETEGRWAAESRRMPPPPGSTTRQPHVQSLPCPRHGAPWHGDHRGTRDALGGRRNLSERVTCGGGGRLGTELHGTDADGRNAEKEAGCPETGRELGSKGGRDLPQRQKGVGDTRSKDQR